mmetsp:Transcript_38357/g.69511  ORF Transcript_38357/g.69511 Transcript_38357/m.69511 type:complete len:116 (-) Transcript_38357:389-736(-)
MIASRPPATRDRHIRNLRNCIRCWSRHPLWHLYRKTCHCQTLVCDSKFNEIRPFTIKANATTAFLDHCDACYIHVYFTRQQCWRRLFNSLAVIENFPLQTFKATSCSHGGKFMPS